MLSLTFHFQGFSAKCSYKRKRAVSRTCFVLTMAYSIKVNMEIPAIEATFSGIVSLDEVQTAFKEKLDLSYKHQVRLFLADCTHLSGGGSILNSYEFAKQIAETPNVHRLKEAFILPIQNEAADSIRFFETTARNRGLNILVFPSREAAIQWLVE